MRRLNSNPAKTVDTNLNRGLNPLCLPLNRSCLLPCENNFLSRIATRRFNPLKLQELYAHQQRDQAQLKLRKLLQLAVKNEVFQKEMIGAKMPGLFKITHRSFVAQQRQMSKFLPT